MDQPELKENKDQLELMEHKENKDQLELMVLLD